MEQFREIEELRKELAEAWQARKQAELSCAQTREFFLSAMRHELRVPATGIINIAELLLKSDLNDRQRNFIQLVHESAANLLASINATFDVEKLLTGNLALERAPFRLMDKIAGTLQSHISRAEEKGLSVFFQNSIPGELVVTGDAPRLAQVLNTVLTNAISATIKGNIIINTRVKSFTDEAVIAECLLKMPGKGINEDIIKELSAPQINNHGAVPASGTPGSLGWFLCKSLVELQGGFLHIDNKGSTTNIRFDVPYMISIEDIPASWQKEYYSLKNRRALVAESGNAAESVSRYMLESWGLEVVIAADGRDALEKLLATDFDIALIDVQLPEADGLTCTRLIREFKDPAKAALPVIGLSTSLTHEEVIVCKAAGMNDLLEKPFDEMKLFRVIEKNLIQEKIKYKDMQESDSSATKLSLSQKLYDLSTIIAVSGGDEDFVKKMVALFIETVPANLKDLNAALKKKNWDMVSKMSHKLKSTIDSMGIDSIKAEVRTVEQNSKKLEALDEIPAMIQKINIVIERSMQQMETQVLQAS